MQVCSRDALSQKKCGPCSGQVAALDIATTKAQLAELQEGWYLTHNDQRIRKDWKVRNFKVGMAFLQQVGDIAEEEGHHPDFHLEGYQYVAIEIWTHSIGGLSENDFILAAKIDQVPVELSKKQPKRKVEESINSS
ncbi:unnamed protein product [Cylindrotheca closterium]|uniref:4a-hydroxytetrahydrobiopterin dehydratase n=1 Tax=Cylindrotheca closterium TaxID=2856 RepID=A0AAD2FCA4_9STRA|nr:unnamed protein product [Cylindrotheca closterium]